MRKLGMTIGNGSGRTVAAAIGGGRCAGVPAISVVLLCLGAVLIAMLQPRPFGSGPVAAPQANALRHLSGTWRAGATPRPRPLAFHMSGLFSAELVWNGELIGRKGIPGVDAKRETPGPIDAAIIIPERLIENGVNRWSLRMSSHHAGYRSATVVQALEIGPYRGAGRSPAHYLPALLLFGAIIAVAPAALRAGGRHAYAVALSGAALIVATTAEVSRSLVNYGYDWHLYRQLATLAFLFLHIVFLTAAVLAESTRHPRRVRGLCAYFLTLAVASAVFATGIDVKIGWTLTAGYALILALAVSGGLRSPGGGRAATVAGVGLAFIGLDLPAFLDAGVYALGLAALLAALSRTTAAAPAALAALLQIRSAGREQIVPWSRVCELRALGNRTEIGLLDGTRLIDQRGIGTLMAMAPGSFMRVHKSFAANLDFAIGIETVSRGAYRLICADGRRLPLNRKRRAAVSQLLADRVKSAN